MRKLGLLVISVFCVAVSLFAQDPAFRVDGILMNATTQKPESGVRVYVQQGGKVVGEITSQANGKYDLKVEIDYSKPFDLYFKKDNFFSKRIAFDYTKLNPEDDLPAGDVRPWSNASIDLISKSTTAELSFLETEPIAKFGNGVSPVPDIAYNDKMKVKVKAAVDAAANQQNSGDANYQAVIKEADALYLNQKKYEAALAKYEEASGLKPSELYPIKRIEEIDALLKAQREQNLENQQADSEYYNLIKAADALRDQKNYPQSLAKYKEALSKKDEQYPKDEISKLEKIIEDQQRVAENQQKYAEAIKMADMFYNQKSFEAAKEKYTVATKLKPTEQHPKNRLAEIDKKLNELSAQKDAKKRYDDLIAGADELFTQEKWAEAKSTYEEAIKIESASSYPEERIKICVERLTALQKEKERTEKIAQFLKEGGDFFAASKWSEAQIKYNEVLKLDESNTEASTRLATIAEKLKEQETLAARELQWTKLVQEGDAAVKTNQFESAKSKYEEALGIKSDASVQTKLDAVIAKIKEQTEKANAEALFQQLKKDGLALMVEQKWQEAKNKLIEAKAIKEDQVVTVKLAEIEKVLQQEATASQLEKEYQDALALGETKTAAGDLDGAIEAYKVASTKKPIEKLPKDKIKELEQAKLERSKQQEADARYAELMKKGDQWMSEKNYVAAIREYNQALTFKPTEKEPVDKAAEAERLEKEKNSELDQLYSKMIEASEKEITEKNYTKAREYADRALKNRPEDPKPKELLSRISTLEKQQRDYDAKMDEAALQFTAQKLELARSLYQQAQTIKSDETKPQERIDEINKLINERSTAAQLETQYQDFMAKGNGEFRTKNYTAAIVQFESALTVKPEDRVAKDKIQEIQQIIDNEQNKLKADQERQLQFNGYLAQGDAEFSASNYESALNFYEQALGADPSSKTVKQKIETTRAKLNEVKELNAEKAYAQLLKKADDFFGLRNYDQARSTYQEALSQKPADNYPQRKLNEIDAILNSSTSKLLPDLGTPIDNSSIDGYALLVKADLERKNAQIGAIDAKVNGVNKVLEKNDRINGFAIQTMNNHIVNIVENADQTTESSEEKNQRTINYLEEVAEQLIKEESETERNQDGQNRKAVAKIDAIDQNINRTEQDNTTVSTENNERIKRIELGIQGVDVNQMQSDASQSVNMNQSLQVIESVSVKNASIAYNEAVRNDRRLTEQVEGSQQRERENIIDVDLNINEKQKVIAAYELKAQDNFNNDRLMQNTNEERIRKIDQTLTANQQGIIADQDRSMQATGAQIEGIQQRSAIAVQNQEQQGLITNTLVDKKTGYLIKAEDNQLSKEKTQTIDQTQRVMKIDDQINREEKRQSVNTIDNSAKINRIESNLTTTETKALNKEKDQSMSVDSKVGRFDGTLSSQQTKLLDQERSRKHGYIEAGSKAETAQQNTELQLTSKSFAHGVALDTRLNTEKSKVKTPNAIGLEYPEGVTEENFTRSDSFGYVTAYLTRRVVVREGQGDVYVRTQTIDHTTYAKNGKPITEEMWIEHTQGSDLVKHTKP